MKKIGKYSDKKLKENSNKLKDSILEDTKIIKVDSHEKHTKPVIYIKSGTYSGKVSFDDMAEFEDPNEVSLDWDTPEKFAKHRTAEILSGRSNKLILLFRGGFVLAHTALLVGLEEATNEDDQMHNLAVFTIAATSTIIGLLIDIQRQQRAIIKENKMTRDALKQNLLDSSSEISKLKDVSKEELDNAVKRNQKLIEIKKERREIESDDKLMNYYKTYQMTFESYFIGYRNIYSKLTKLEPKSRIATTLQMLSGIPEVGSVFNYLSKAVIAISSVNLSNESGKFNSVAGTTVEMDSIIEYVARKLTLKKKIIIENADNGNIFGEMWSHIRHNFQPFFFDPVDTPEAKLAKKDAMIAVCACASGRFTSNLTVKKFSKELLKLYEVLDFETVLASEIAKYSNEDINSGIYVPWYSKIYNKVFGIKDSKIITEDEKADSENKLSWYKKIFRKDNSDIDDYDHGNKEKK